MGGAGIKFRKSHRSSRKSIKTMYKQKKRQIRHVKKLRKAAKDDSVKFRFAKKDPGIPNKWPHKKEILLEMQKVRESYKEQAKLRKGERLKKGYRDSSEEEDNGVVPDIITEQ